MADDLSFLQSPIPEASNPAEQIDDYVKWAFEQAALIKAGRFDQVDILNVAEEIEDVGKSEIRAFESHLEVVLIHMLKWDFQPAKRSRSWDASIFSNRHRILRLLKVNPSLRARQEASIEAAYEFARRSAARQTRLDLASFPEACPYDWSQIMESPYDFGRS